MDYLITIALPGQSPQQISMPCGAYLIGRGTDCPIRLEDSSVSELHAKLILSPTEAWIEDVGSSNGTIVNATPITGTVRLTDKTIVSVGNTIFRVQPKQVQVQPTPPAPPPQPQVAPQPIPPPPLPKADPPPQPINLQERSLRRDIKAQIHDELIRRLDLKRLATSSRNLADHLARGDRTQGIAAPN